MGKSAFVHDRIVHLGGAEQVFMDLIRTYAREKALGKANLDSPERETTPLITTTWMHIFCVFSTSKKFKTQ